MAPINAQDVVVSNMELEKVFSMKGGNGEASYANNSQAQARHAQSMFHLLREAMDGVSLRSPETPFVVADLGCSCGSNTICTVELIIKHMSERYEAANGGSVPEFTAYFSDLPSNDFNTLFQLLPPFGHDTMEECLASGGPTHRSYFAAAAPGSFYRRLFASNTLDFVYSAFSLHWLSQVPEAVVDKNSEAYNKGRIFTHGASQCTSTAYKNQYQSDLASFLVARSKEMKKGGSMFLVCLGRTSSDPSDQGGAGILFGTHFQDAWDDLVQEGLIASEKRDSFNIPLYAASLDEFKEVVVNEGSFVINKLEIFRAGSPLVVEQPEDAAEVGQALAITCRSVGGVLVDAHIGDHLSDVLFARVASRGASHAKELKEHLQFSHIVASLSLPNV